MQRALSTERGLICHLLAQPAYLHSVLAFGRRFNGGSVHVANTSTLHNCPSPPSLRPLQLMSSTNAPPNRVTSYCNLSQERQDRSTR
ncbi:hypothetical protein IQ06DRAFT_49541 [Phaeosphaeriaceae sp. SRC1lsM3a]|nr:hypothetical protein IQ06DRAFT_49541 [Stagonospora sp. SRC1lsM3a]